jgi:ribonuclease P protein component
MFSRFHRLNFSLSQDRSLFRTGTIYNEPSFQLAFDFKGKSFQFGVLVPKKIIAKATTRNALRRVIISALPRSIVELSNLRLAVKLTSTQATKLSQEQWVGFFEKFLATLNKQT